MNIRDAFKDSCIFCDAKRSSRFLCSSPRCAELDQVLSGAFKLLDGVHDAEARASARGLLILMARCVRIMERS